MNSLDKTSEEEKIIAEAKRFAADNHKNEFKYLIDVLLVIAERNKRQLEEVENRNKIYTWLIVVLGAIAVIPNFKAEYWFTYFTLGGTAAFGFLNYTFFSRGESIFGKLKTHSEQVIKKYFQYFLCGFLIEAVGRWALHFWQYPTFDTFQNIFHVYLVGYPFVFFMLYEIFLFMKLILKKAKINSDFLAFIVTWFSSAFLVEWLNLSAKEWLYNLPQAYFNPLGINGYVILGWSLLVAISIVIGGSYLSLTSGGVSQ